jgi:hypothetical protein
MPRFSQSELDERADTMRRIGYPQHQVDEQLRKMRAGIYTPLDGLGMIDGSGGRVVRLESDGLSADGKRATLTVNSTALGEA